MNSNPVIVNGPCPTCGAERALRYSSVDASGNTGQTYLVCTKCRGSFPSKIIDAVAKLPQYYCKVCRKRYIEFPEMLSCEAGMCQECFCSSPVNHDAATFTEELICKSFVNQKERPIMAEKTFGEQCKYFGWCVWQGILAPFKLLWAIFNILIEVSVNDYRPASGGPPDSYEEFLSRREYWDKVVADKSDGKSDDDPPNVDEPMNPYADIKTPQVRYLMVDKPLNENQRKAMLDEWEAAHEHFDPKPRLIIIGPGMRLLSDREVPVFVNPIHTFSGFQEEALKTEAKVDRAMLERFGGCNYLIYDALLRIAAIGECLDDLKKYVFYGKTADIEGIRKQLKYLGVDCDYPHATWLMTPAFRREDMREERLALRFLHGVLGKATEFAELHLTLHKLDGWLSKPGSNLEDFVDTTNVGEEIFDDFWYSMLCLSALAINPEDGASAVISKLQKVRYKQGSFSATEAVSRNAEDERASLEEHFKTGKNVTKVSDTSYQRWAAEQQIAGRREKPDVRRDDSTRSSNVSNFHDEFDDGFGKICKPGWYFFDEAGLLGGGPYPTEDDAIANLIEYGKTLNEGTD